MQIPKEPVDHMDHSHDYYYIVICILYGNIYSIKKYLKNACGFVRYCVLLDCESLMPPDFIPLFVIHVWHTRFPLTDIRGHEAPHHRFPLNRIKKYLTIHEGGHIGSRRKTAKPGLHTDLGSAR